MSMYYFKRAFYMLKFKVWSSSSNVTCTPRQDPLHLTRQPLKLSARKKENINQPMEVDVELAVHADVKKVTCPGHNSMQIFHGFQ